MSPARIKLADRPKFIVSAYELQLVPEVVLIPVRRFVGRRMVEPTVALLPDTEFLRSETLASTVQQDHEIEVHSHVEYVLDHREVWEPAFVNRPPIKTSRLKATPFFVA